MKAKMVLKKGLAAVMTAACIVGLLPQGVLAEEIAEDKEVVEEIVPESGLTVEESDYADLDVPEVPDYEDGAVSDVVSSDEAAAEFEVYNLGEDCSGTIEKYSYKFYKFELPSAGRITIKTESNGSMLKLMNNPLTTDDFDFDESVIWRHPANGASVYKGEYECYLDLIKGTYYFMEQSGISSPNQIEYSFNISFKPVEVLKDEKSIFDSNVFGSNNYEEDAVEIKVDTAYVAQSTEDTKNNEDWYWFKLTKDSPLYLTASTDQIDLLKIRFYTEGVNGGSAQLISIIPDEAYKIGIAYPSVRDAENSIDTEVIATKDLKPDGTYNQTVFPAGIYLMNVETFRNRGDSDLYGATGAYHFKVLTNKPVAVDGVKIYEKGSKTEAKSISLATNGTKDLEAYVSPAKATVKTVSWSIDDETVATVEDGTVTGLKEGKCTLTVTTDGRNANGDQLTATCEVNVLGEAEEITDCPTVITGQKVDLTSKEFFNVDSFNTKIDKLTVLDKDQLNATKPKASKNGSVSKTGLFTAKKPVEDITVIWSQKVDSKTFVEKKRVTFTIETPVIAYPVLANGKQSKTIPINNKGVYDVSGLISTTKYTGSPTFTAKSNKNFEFDSDNNEVTVKGNGSFNIVVYYYADNNIKNAAKYTIKLKADLPKFSNKITVNRGKTKNVTITKLPAGANLQWGYYEYDEESEAYVDTELFECDFQDTTCTITGGDEKGVGYVIAFVDEEEYVCTVTIK